MCNGKKDTRCREFAKFVVHLPAMVEISSCHTIIQRTACAEIVLDILEVNRKERVQLSYHAYRLSGILCVYFPLYVNTVWPYMPLIK